MATNRTFSGQLIFWDSRGNRSNATGTRLPTCDTTQTSCTPGSTGCCWRFVPNARVSVQRNTNPPFVIVCNTWTSTTGTFSCAASNEPDGSATYKVTIHSKHSNMSGYVGGRADATVSGNTQFVTHQVTTSSTSVNFGVRTANAVGDTTSAIGNAFTAFVAADEVFRFLDQEGETRHHLSNAFIGIEVAAGANSTDCDDREINVQAAYSRALELVHLLGFIYMGQVTGCSSNVPAYPTYLAGGYDTYTAEGNALRVGIPSLLVTLSRFNPSTASTASIFSSIYPCVGIGSNNANHASYERNNWHALWELIDTDTGNTSGDGSDSLDLTLADVMDGLVYLKNRSGSQGDDNTNAEQVLNAVPSSVCFSASGCSAYDACVGYVCYSGDPHGENIWDLAANICADQGCAGLSLLSYLSTVVSSPCLGMYDNDHPFNGGFHLD